MISLQQNIRLNQFSQTLKILKQSYKEIVNRNKMENEVKQLFKMNEVEHPQLAPKQVIRKWSPMLKTHK